MYITLVPRNSASSVNVINMYWIVLTKLVFWHRRGFAYYVHHKNISYPHDNLKGFNMCSR